MIVVKKVKELMQHASYKRSVKDNNEAYVIHDVIAR
jgi:hypothetical protein